MQVYLVRHAHALPDIDDGRRTLSDEGRRQVAQLIRFFSANGCFTPGVIWHSPLTRAIETAGLLKRALCSEASLVETPGLLPENDPREIGTRLARLSGKDHIAVVGHEPHLGSLATLLARGKPRPVAFDVRKAAVIALERTDHLHKKSGEPRWLVQWQVSPELLP